MSARHRTRRTLGRGRFRVPVVLAAVGALVAVTAITVRIVSASASSCTGGLALNVVASPDIAPALEEIGNAWMADQPQVAGRCVQLTVHASASAKVASSLTVHAGSAIDTAAVPEPTPGPNDLPTVWVPDSTAWLTRVQSVDRAAFVDDARSIASSPVVIAMPEAAAKAIGWPSGRFRVADIKAQLAGGGALKLGIAEPRRETASLAATMLLGEGLVTSDEDLPGLVKAFRGVTKTASTGELLRALGPKVLAGPASEQAVVQYAAGKPPVAIVAVQTEPSAPLLDYPYAIRSGISREETQAAEAFRAAVLGTSATGVLAKAAFRTPDGRTAPDFPASKATSTEPTTGEAISSPERVQRALGLWTAANSPSRTLALFDITSSMGTLMQTAAGPATRAAVMVAAARGGLELFAASSKVGMWAFGAAHQEVLPIAEMDAARRNLFEQRMTAARPLPTNESKLYDTLIAAYKVMKDGYDPTRPNLIVVLTDGGDSDPGGVHREKFSQELQRLADPTRPIRVVLIGVNVSQADAADLRAIAEVVGGGFFPMTSPEQIGIIFLKALLRVGAA